MTSSFKPWLRAPLLALVLAGFVLVPIANAAGRGGGGGGHAAARAGGGGHSGGAGQRAYPDNRHADARSNNVRNTSVNNVNVNRNVNVNQGGGGWNNNYHPVATAAAVTATVAVTAAVVGSIVQTVPPNCSPYNYNGIAYQQCGSTWYQPQYVGNQVQYVVVNPPN